MPSIDEKRSSENSQERLTRPPENEQGHNDTHEKQTEPTEETIPSAPGEQGIPRPAKELGVSRSISGSDVQAREFYTDWQFIVVFVVSVEIAKIPKPRCGTNSASSQSRWASMQHF